MTTQSLDESRVDEFTGRALEDFAGLMTSLFCILGDRLGLFAALHEDGPATSEELAGRAGLDERYVREWLRGLTAAGYIELDRATGRWTLPPEHAAVLAEEGGHAFMGGAFQEVAGALPVLGRVAEAFRTGGGVPQEAYDSDFWTGMERFTAGWFQHLLLPEWLPAVPRVRAQLERGAELADVGCGAGRAVVTLAQAFPSSRFVGFDAFEPQLELARENAERAGVGDRVRFERRDVAVDGLPGAFDVVTTFDVVHDAIDPPALLRAIRRALREDGTYLMLEIACADDPADNTGPLAALFYGFSLLYCMTTSLAHGGAGLGTCGMPEARVRELCLAAGFGSVQRAPVDDPFNSLYEVRP